MKTIDMNNIEYTSIASGTQSEVTWDDQLSRSVITNGNESEALETVVLMPVRTKRNKLLQDSDWRVVISDYPNSDVEEWKTYRQSLRDLPGDYVEGEDTVFPTQP